MGEKGFSLLQVRAQEKFAAIRTGECSESDGTSYFLGNEYIELGVSPRGDFGTKCLPSTGFYTGRGKIGMTSAFSGFDGSGPFIDYFLPGTPEERFGIGYKTAGGGSTIYGGDNSLLMGKNDISISSMSVEADGVSFTGTLHGKIRMDCKYTLKPGEKHFDTLITFTNEASEELIDVRYHRSFDPDNTKYYGGEYRTDNKIIARRADGDSFTLVSATSRAGDSFFSTTGKRSTIFFMTADDRAEGFIGGFSNTYRYSYTNSAVLTTPQAKGYTHTGDEAIQITFGLGNMPAGSSTTVAYNTVLQYVDTLDDIEAIGKDVPPPVVSSSGDPHMINIKGDAFDIYRTGVWEFLRVPREATSNIADFRIMANVSNIGDEVDRCTKALYINRFTLGGNWLNNQDLDVRVLNGAMSVYVGKTRMVASSKPFFFGKSPHGLLRLDMQRAGFMTIRIGSATIALGVDQKPVHNYLNLQATGLSNLGYSLGGLLGEDDHSWISMRPAACSQKYKTFEAGSSVHFN